MSEPELMSVLTKIDQRLERLEQQNRDLQEQNETLRREVSEALAMTPQQLTETLNQFIQQLSELLQNRQSGEMSELIKELINSIAALSSQIQNHNRLSQQLHDDITQLLASTQNASPTASPPSKLN